MKCSDCNRELPDNAKFCSYCGHQITNDSKKNLHNHMDIQNNKIQHQNRSFNFKQNILKEKKIKIVLGITAVICVVGIVSFLFFKNDRNQSTVSQPKSKNNEVELKLKKNEFKIEVDQHDYIEANINCTYKVKDENIAEIDQFGTITALSPGQTEIIVKGENGKNIICKVTVYETENTIEILNYEASSTLEQKPYHYEVNQLYDDNYSTCWSEGVDYNGIGEIVKINLTKEVKINQLNIVNGYGKKEDLYYKNSRVKKLALIFDDGVIEYVDIQDNFNQLQNIRFQEHKTQTIIVRIEEIYQGNKYQDTCISELTVGYNQ